MASHYQYEYHQYFVFCLGSSSAAGSYTAVLGSTATGAQVLLSGALGSFGGSTLGAVLHWSDGKNFYKAYINGKLLVISNKVNGSITTLSMSHPE